MIYITSKTHRYISIRIRPSDYIMKKYDQLNTDELAGSRYYSALIESYSIYYEFYKKFIEFSTKKDYDYYEEEYFLSAKECSTEELHELTGIKIAETGNNVIYCIPRKEENDKLFDFIIENSPNHKVLKKTRGTFMDHGPTRFNRDRLMKKMPSEIR